MSVEPLPVGWHFFRLGDISKLVGGSTPATTNPLFWDGELVWVTPTDLGCLSAMTIITSSRRITFTGLQSCAAAMVPVGAVVMSSRAPIGHLAVAGVPLCTNQGCKSFIPISGVDSGFLFWALKHSVSDIRKLGSGATFAEVSKTALEHFKVALPSPPEQQRISAALTEQMAAVDRARAAAEVRLESTKALPAASLREVFGTAATLTASPLTPTVPAHAGWHWSRLTDVARLATGHTPSRYRPEYWKGSIPWLQLADIRALDCHEAQCTSEYTNDLGLANSAAVLLPEGTVCMSRTASVGFFTIMGRPMATSQDFVNWVCGDKLDPWFLMYLLAANRKRLRDLGSGAVHQTIYFPTVQSFSVCVPPVAEQRRLATLLRERIQAAEAARAGAEAELETINALPAALLRRAFAGEL